MPVKFPISKILNLNSKSVQFNLDTSSGLRAVNWKNGLNGDRLALGMGPEFELDFDAAERRLYIEGWRVCPSDLPGPKPDSEAGYRNGFFKTEFNDSAWTTAITPSLAWWLNPEEYYWARTHLFLPEDIARQPLTLVLGGFGLWDFRFMRVFLNGNEIAIRETTGRWFEPGRFDIRFGTEAHQYLRFGRDNIITLQLARPIRRTKRLDEMDPMGAHSMPFNTAGLPHFEQYLVVGQDRLTPRFVVTGARLSKRSTKTACTVSLKAVELPLTAKVAYEWTDDGRTLLKKVHVRNTGRKSLRLLEVRLGTYRTTGFVSEGDQGFPVYLNDDRFASIAHPSGWATGQDGQVGLRHYPGCLIPSGKSWTSLTAVLSVALAGEAKAAFVSHIRARMRRVVRGHEHPIAIFEPFGAKPDGSFWETEEFLLDNIRRLREGCQATGAQFDYYSVDFWTHCQGELTDPDPGRFPNGFGPILEALRPMKTRMGLWCDSSYGDWNIGNNPVVAPSRVNNPAYPPQSYLGLPLCRAAEPFRSLFTGGFCHHIRNNGVRLVKFDNLWGICHNLGHSHLPGVYSTEAIQSAVIETLQALDKASPEVFIMLYWGYRSPWWLLHGDTLFENGIMMEAATPSARPSLYARDGVTVCLDQGHAWADEIPVLGKESLGVWLSSWPWHSSIGKERWAEGMVMDICRGSLLVQPWSDTKWLTPKERKQFADLLALVRERPDCFGHPKPILAGAWSGRPYGYCCSNGRRGFLALNNCTWEDSPIDLDFSEKWGLKRDLQYRLFRHHPNPAELRGEGESFRDGTRLWLRPFDVVLIEAVPLGEQPSGNGTWIAEKRPAQFDSASCERPLLVKALPSSHGPLAPIEEDEKKDGKNAPDGEKRRAFSVSGTTPACKSGGILVVAAELRRDGRMAPAGNLGRHFAAVGRYQGKTCPLQPVLAPYTFPANWQAWRLTVPPGTAGSFRLEVVFRYAGNVKLVWTAHFIPALESGCYRKEENPTPIPSRTIGRGSRRPVKHL